MDAPGKPGIAPTWTSSAKDMVGSALGPSRLWFTVGHGVVNEIYHPRIDTPQIRDLGFIVADGEGFWVEVKRNLDHTVTTAGPGVPAVQVAHRHPRFELDLRIAPDPDRDVLLVEAVLKGDAKLKLYVLLAPHLGGTGYDNVAEVFINRNDMVLCAEQGGRAAALAAVETATQRDGWARASAGYVGSSDGWQDFHQNSAMTWSFPEAGPGNVSLMGEARCREITLALGFGTDKEAAATLAISALLQSFESVWRRHVEAWRAWQTSTLAPDLCDPAYRDALQVAAMVLRTHQDKTYPGAMVASLSIPWGDSHNDTGGYHLVWPRDIVESAGALLALGAYKEAQDTLRYLIATQLTDGRWCQNQWLGGQPHWNGIQLDEAAFPVLLAEGLARVGQLDGILVEEMVKGALRFVVLNGPSTDQDRWEETPGVNAFTLAIAIAAMVGGAEFIDPKDQGPLLELADEWNAHIEAWLVASNPELCEAHGVKSYYVRSTPARIMKDAAAVDDLVPVRNHPGGLEVPASTLIATDFLQLVRFGLRQADDPIVKDSLIVVDNLLKADTPNGPAWRRYNGDGYGEHDDGSPYNGSGVGRPWPLLTGERGHYALCTGDLEETRRLLDAMVKLAGCCGMMGEQVWDAEPIAEYDLYPGRPSGSAMPLVWAHAEFAKLALSLKRGAPVDRPQAVWDRYKGKAPKTTVSHWMRAMPMGEIPRGQPLRFIFNAPALIHWCVDEWTGASDLVSAPGFLGLEVVDIPAEVFAKGAVFRFSVQDLASKTWTDHDQAIRLI